jgi:hypothetical protein
MKKLLLACVIALAFSTTAMAIDIGCSTQVSWWGEADATAVMENIAANVPVSVEIFSSSEDDALADWLTAHTGNGQSDLLILSGRVPTSIYTGGNAQPDGSIAELFLDDGNCIINTGDWFFYVSNPNNGGDGLANLMDVPGISMGEPIVDVTPTADGALYTPSFAGFSPSRPWHLEQLDGTDWAAELIMGINDDGTRADPAIVVNTVTGARVGSFFQVAGALVDEKSAVISEWINNWYLLNAAAPLVARGPVPADEAVDVPRDVALGWTPGPSAVARDVYFGTVFDDVNSASRANPMDVLVSEGQSGETYESEGLLDFSTTYYWRIDEVNGAPDNTIFKGNVWSFTAEPFAYPITNITATSNAIFDAVAGPENTINGSGLNADDQHSTLADDMFLGTPAADPIYLQYEFDSVYKLHEMLAWNYNVQFEPMLGFGFKDVTVEYSADGVEWTVLGEVELAQATATSTYTANTTVDFGGAAVKYVKLTVNSGHGPLGQFGLSEVRFMFIPAQAREPQPADGAADVSVDTALAWRAGRDAVSHEVAIGTDPAALPAADAAGANTYDPGVLNLGTTYHWQVTAIQDTESWAGSVWSFATQDYLVVDDFESYNDEDKVIYETWIDGWVNETGSTVGYLSAPFAEETIVNSGGQSMPLSYDNAGVATAEAELELGQNWTASGIQSLSLYFYGDVGNSGGQLYVKIDGTKIAYDGSAVNITRATWQLWNIDLAASGASLSNVSSLTIGIEGAGATGVVYIDDIRLYPEVLGYHKFPDITAAGDTVVGVPNDGDWPDAETPDLAVDDDVNTKFLHRQGGAMATGIQVTPAVGATVVTGLTFTTANDAPTRDPITFELSGSNASIDGPYELIAAGDIVDFAGATDWPRFTKNATVIAFDNDVAYAHYQIVFPTLRGESEALMQIAEVEFIGAVTP